MIISYCGLNCQGCPIYFMTRETDEIKKEKMVFDIISVCKEKYGIEYSAADITDCDGCKSETGRIFKACANCKIRNCAIDKGIENCAYCEDYACDNLMELFKTDSSAKYRLDLIRSGI